MINQLIELDKQYFMNTFGDRIKVAFSEGSGIELKSTEGETYYDVKYNNTDASDQYGTENNLIELVKSANGGWVYGKNDSLSASTKTDSGKKVAYVFNVNEITEENATVTFRKNN